MSTTVKKILGGLVLMTALFAEPMTFVNAAPPNSPYEPGETITPSCDPGTPNCTVRAFTMPAPLSVPHGGTGLSMFSTEGLLYASGTSTVSIIGAGQNGDVLKVVNGNLEWGTDLLGSGSFISGTGIDITNNIISIATSTLGLTTNNISESNNLFYTPARVQNYLDSLTKNYFFSTSSTLALINDNLPVTLSTTSLNFWLTQKNSDDMIQGASNKFYDTALFARDLAATTTDALAEGTRLFFTNGRVQNVLDGLSKDYFFSTTSVSNFITQNPTLAFATSSVDHWLTQKTTDNLLQGTTNKFYNTALFAADFAGTTTAALREDPSRLYFTTGRVQSVLDALDKSYFFSTSSISNFISQNPTLVFSTTSTNYWLNQKTTDDLTQGVSNKFYATSLFATDLAATTTDGLKEGTNLYFTNSRVQGLLDMLPKTYFFSTSSAAYFLAQNLPVSFSTTSANFWLGQQTTDSLPQGPTNKFYSSTLFNQDFITKTTSNLSEGSNLYFTNSRVQALVDALPKSYFFGTTSATYFLSQNMPASFSTTSANAWLTQKTTDNLTQGVTNKFYSSQLFASDLLATTSVSTLTSLPNLSVLGTITSGTWQGTPIDAASYLTNFGTPFYSYFHSTTTDALSEGSSNKFYSDLRVGSYISGSTTLPSLANSNTWTGLQRFNGGASTTALSLSGNLNAGSVFTVNQTTGRVGIGTTSPSKTFSLNGTLAISGLTGLSGISGNALCLSNSGTGEVLLNGAVSCLLSSRRYKHDIETSYAGLDLVNALRPVTFYFNADTENKDMQYGFIAEEVAAVDRKLVDLDETGVAKTVRYEEFTSVLARAIQDLSRKFDTLASSTAATVSSTFDSIFAKKVETDSIQTKQLCVGSTCVSDQEFLDMVNTLHQVKEPRTTPEPVVPVVPPLALVTASSTSDNTASTTEQVNTEPELSLPDLETTPDVQATSTDPIDTASASSTSLQ